MQSLFISFLAAMLVLYCQSVLSDINIDMTLHALLHHQSATSSFSVIFVTFRHYVDNKNILSYYYVIINILSIKQI